MNRNALLLAAAVLVAALPLTARAETRLEVARRASASTVCYQPSTAQKDANLAVNGTEGQRSYEARTSAKPCYHNDKLTLRQRM
jgi:hypothetical protein